MPAIFTATFQVAAIGCGGGSGKRFGDASSRIGPSATLKVAVADQACYSGAAVACTSVPHGTDLVPEPAVVFEVFSAGTAATDGIQANDGYWLTPPIRRCVVLQPSGLTA